MNTSIYKQLEVAFRVLSIINLVVQLSHTFATDCSSQILSRRQLRTKACQISWNAPILSSTRLEDTRTVVGARNIRITVTTRTLLSSPLSILASATLHLSTN